MNEKAERDRTVRRTLWTILELNLAVAAAKITLGLAAGAVSILADGLHSLMDGSSNVVGLVGMRIAGEPPDREHPYGHRKAETLATLGIGALLLFAAFEILQRAIQGLADSAGPQVTPLTFVVMLATLAVNITVTTVEHRLGKKLRSSILLADAAHTRVDVFVTLSVIAGLIGVSLGYPWLDGVVALGVVGVILFTAVRILQRAAQVLIDRQPLAGEELDVVEALALAVPGVLSCERIRSRGHEDDVFIDLHVRVAPDTPTDEAHAVAHAVQQRITAGLPQVSEAMVHIEPGRVTEEHDHGRTSRELYALARSLGAAVHEVWMHTINDAYHVELHLEVDPELSLGEAHAIASRFEQQAHERLKEVEDIITHIEPKGRRVESSPLEEDEKAPSLVEMARLVADGVFGREACHEVRVHSLENGHVSLSMHCTLPAEIPLEEAHALSEEVQARLRHRAPHLERVVVHVEPHD